MTDPYKVMDLSPSASEEEIKQAYRRLAKKYHPDLNPNNQAAAEKMQQINVAYEQIKDQRQGKTSYSQQSTAGTSGRPNYERNGDPYGQGNPGQGNPFDDEDFYRQFGDLFGRARQRHTAGSPRMQAVFHFIDHRQYQQALHVLSGIQRDAEWFYASAIANAGVGNRVTALNHAQRAVQLEPNNGEYLSLLEQFQHGSYAYQEAGRGYGFDMSNISRTLLQLCMLQMTCMCCCRGCTC